jgi:peptidyl-prolyl cis-trans isomerase SurA
MDEIEAAISGDSTLYHDAVEVLVEEKLLIEGAIRSGFYPSDEEVSGLVDTRIEEMRAVFPDEQSFLAALSEVGLTMESLRIQLSVVLGEQVAMDQYVRAMTRDAFTAVTTDPASYLCSSAESVEETMMPRHLYWIYIPVLPSGELMMDVREELLGLRLRILSGESFEELAMVWSEDGSAEGGGDLGWFSEGDMTPTFENAIFSLAEGELSMPVVTPVGVHLIRLDEVADDGRMRASHILRIVPSSPEDFENAVSRADSISQLIEGGMPFTDAAALFSVDHRTAVEGGNLGVVLVKGWSTGYADALEGLEPGEVSEPVTADGGTAVLLFMTDSGCYDGASVDWSIYSDAYLADLARSVAFQNEFRALKDSLLTTIPVTYRLGTDED